MVAAALKLEERVEYAASDWVSGRPSAEGDQVHPGEALRGSRGPLQVLELPRHHKLHKHTSKRAKTLR